MIRVPLFLLIVFALAGCALERNARPDAAVPDDLRQVEVLAMDAYRRGDWAEAERFYTELGRRVPAEAEVWFRLGNIHARLGRPEEAITAYREALVRDPESAKAWYNMGVLQVRQAMNSFARMQGHVGPEAPLHEQSMRVYEGLKALVRGGE